MPTVEWTDPELVRDALVVLARPGVGDELRALGVADGSGFGPRCILVPSDQDEYARRRIAEELAAADEARRPAPAGADALLEQVLAHLALEQRPAKLKPGVKPTDVPLKTRRRVAELRIAGDGPAAIMRDTGLSKTIATRLVRDVDDALGTIRAGRY